MINSPVRSKLVVSGPRTMQPTLEGPSVNPVNTGTFRVGDTLGLT